MSDPVFVSGIAGVIDLVARRAKMATAATPSLAGKPYCPSTGSEGAAFEDAWCSSCDRYRGLYSPDDTPDCTLGHLVGAYTAAPDTNDPLFPKAWVYDEGGRPSCSDWVKRTSAADTTPIHPRLCGGVYDPEQERAAYERAMRGEA